MNEKFKNIPVDDDTKIIFESTMKFEENDILYQKWFWDGIYGESIIFIADDVKHLNDDKLKKYVAMSDMVENKDKVTVGQRRDEYVFASFNFKTE